MAFQPPSVIQTARTAFPKAELLFPQILHGPSTEAVSKINEAIRSEVERLVHEQGSLADPRAEMQGYYELKTNEKNVLSLSLYNYAYTGGAHGMTLQKSMTFKQSTGEQYELKDLFKPSSPYVETISAIVGKQIQERGIPTFEPFQSISPDQSFYIADRSLVIYFQLYEIAPYVYGFLYFPISVYELQDIINEDGPLGPMLMND
ncbi:DUF3298 and DUF4163 domain-containing protein [Paenibacillus sp. J5C_2022]|uniref:DUF3298 and DUF4163 domain-containing protein n=1 Tax=Paenibacillus sp. J5C2022 TaxID=2977129 RepID=UPI0021D34F87|nr:DUF3298 and DUF4163 domain-containing protein [Paenibacillus sp. J5C2022]MCU6708166.1 DUF3298 and DUF4163 domain-containing protein [Paenibacillus sp. J5C2022]